MVDNIQSPGALAEQQRAAQERMRQAFLKQAQAEHAAKGLIDRVLDDGKTLDKASFVDQMLATIPEGERAGQKERLEKLYDEFQLQDGDAGLAEDEFVALMTKEQLQGPGQLQPEGGAVTAEEKRALLFKGRDDLGDAAKAQADQLFANRTTLTKAEFVAEATIAGKNPSEMAQLYMQVAGKDGPMSREQFDQAYMAGVGGSTFREVLKDGSDVNQDAAEWRNEQQANAEIRGLTAQVAERLDCMTPEARQKYDTLVQATQNDPQARAALDRMLVDGRLLGGPPNADGKDVLTALADLATQPTQPPLDPQVLACDVLQEIADPTAINQMARGTCGVTTAQILTAMKDPAEYARLIGGLASPAGSVTMRNGDQLVREPGTEQAQKLKSQKPDGTWYEHDDGRSDTSRLFAPAAMEYANGAADYDNTTDQHYRLGIATGGGTSGEGNAALEQALTGVTSEAIDARSEESWGSWIARNVGTPIGIPAPAVDRQPFLDRLEQTVNGGKPIQVGMRWNDSDELARKHGNHELLVTKIDKDFVYYDNPWGQQEKMSRKEFDDRVYVATVPAG